MRRALILLLLMAGCNIPTPPPPPPPPPGIELPRGYEGIVEHWMQTDFAGGFRQGDINGDGRVDWQDWADLSRMDSYDMTACDFGAGDIVVCPKACPVCGYVGYPPTGCAYWRLEQEAKAYSLGTDPGAWLRAEEVMAMGDPNEAAQVVICDGDRDFSFFCSECGEWVRIAYPQAYCALILKRLCETEDLCD